MKESGKFDFNDPDEKLRHQIEIEFDLEPYESGEIDGTYADYMELMIQYGYVVLFAVAFPLSPFLAFINNVLEIQVDKTKIVKFSRRPVPISVPTIGVWASILSGMTYIGIVTNIGVLCFTDESLSDDKNGAFVPFVWLTIGFFAFRAFLVVLIPDISENWSIVKKRNDNVIER
jgi:anoctamin-10